MNLAKYKNCVLPNPNIARLDGKPAFTILDIKEIKNNKERKKHVAPTFSIGNLKNNIAFFKYLDKINYQLLHTKYKLSSSIDQAKHITTCSLGDAHAGTDIYIYIYIEKFGLSGLRRNSLFSNFTNSRKPSSMSVTQYGTSYDPQERDDMSRESHQFANRGSLPGIGSPRVLKRRTTIVEPKYEKFFADQLEYMQKTKKKPKKKNNDNKYKSRSFVSNDDYQREKKRLEQEILRDNREYMVTKQIMSITHHGYPEFIHEKLMKEQDERRKNRLEELKRQKLEASLKISTLSTLNSHNIKLPASQNKQ